MEPDERVGVEQTVEEEDRSYRTLAAVFLTILAIIIVLLLWRSCDTAGTDVRDSDGGGVVQTLPDLERVEGGIAVWARPDASIDQILARNGLRGAEAADLGLGTYVIVVEGDAEALVEQLKRDPGLYDAGFLYSED